jgi:hypothetical protein
MADTIVWKRNKYIAMFIAVFFGPWAWLYTYARDPEKAAAGIGSNLGIVLPLVVMYMDIQKMEKPDNVGEGLVYCAIPALLLLFSTWIIAIAHTIIEKKWQLFGPKGRSKIGAIIIAIFLGPWTWLYTHSKDHWKFWLSIFICYGCFFGNSITGGLIKPWPLPFFISWVAAIVNTSIRKNEWYETFGKK